VTKLQVERARARYGWFDVMVETVKTFSRDDGGSYTAALTYYMFFSLFPILLFSASIVGFLTAGNEELRKSILDAGLSSVPLLRDVLSPAGLEAIEARRGALALTGLFMSLYAGSGAIVALEHALNRFSGVRAEPNWVQKRLRSLKFLGMFGVAVLVSLALGGLAGFAAEIFSPNVHLLVGLLLGHVTGFLVGVLIFASAYRFLPAVDVGWRDVLPGAVTAALAFELLKEFGALFLERGGAAREATFGVFAISAALLVACFLMAQVTLMAAELNNVLMDRRATRQNQGSDKGRPDGSDDD
jgi:inner membrane protein YhjD